MAGEGSALPWCAALNSSPLLLVTRCSTGEQRQVLGDDSFGSRERWPFLLLFCGYPCRQGRHNLPKTEVLREYTALRYVSRESPSAPQSHSRCLWGTEQEKEWTRLCGKLEVKTWATAMGRDYVTVPFSGKYPVWIWFFYPCQQILKRSQERKKTCMVPRGYALVPQKQQPNFCHHTLVLWPSVQCQFTKENWSKTITSENVFVKQLNSLLWLFITWRFTKTVRHH